MRYACVCSGVSAPTNAWKELGWEPAFFVEIDDAPSAVLAHRYPGVCNLRDFTAIRPRHLRRLGLGTDVDVLVGGTPCQSFSVAGLRGGMADARGNLALEFLRLARRLRPRWVVWENVPGVLSSWSHDAPREGGPPHDLEPGCEREVVEEYEADEASDFACFLAGLEELGYGWAYRTLDAQHVGGCELHGDWRGWGPVPQRRRRVFVVAYSGDVARLGRAPSDRDLQRFSRVSAAVLFERSSLRGRDKKGRGKGAKHAARAGGRAAGDHRPTQGIADTLKAHHGRLRPDETFIPETAHTLRGEGFDASGDGTGRGTPMVPVSFAAHFSNQNIDEGLAGTLHHQPHAVAYQCQGSNVGPMGTLRSGNGATTGGVPFIVNAAESCARESHARPSEVARCLDSTGSFANAQGGTVVQVETVVRRLTPVECERLMGFPDDFTLVPYRGGMMADGPRYKMLGNSMAKPPMLWLGKRIRTVEAILRREAQQ